VSTRHRLRRAIAFVACVTMAAVSVASCQDDGDASTAETTAAASTTTSVAPATRLCEADPPVQIGTLQDPGLQELSGLAFSRTQPGVLWAHNDSGDSARLFAMDVTGVPRTTVALDGVDATDWEDLAIAGSDIYVGDTGDNQRARPSIVVHRVTEPDLTATRAEADTFELRYPDGAHDSEALMVDPIADELVVVTKVAAGNSAVYTTPRSEPGALHMVTTIELGVGQLVTGGDISAEGDTIVLRTYTGVFVWARAPGESLAAALLRAPCSAPAAPEPQGEAIGLSPAGDAYVTASEGAGSPIRQVRATPASP
jgi:hypothetical protein